MGARHCEACETQPVMKCGRCTMTRCEDHALAAGTRCDHCERDYSDEAPTRRSFVPPPRSRRWSAIGPFCRRSAARPAHAPVRDRVRHSRGRRGACRSSIARRALLCAGAPRACYPRGRYHAEACLCLGDAATLDLDPFEPEPPAIARSLPRCGGGGSVRGSANAACAIRSLAIGLRSTRATSARQQNAALVPKTRFSAGG
jgi:hypothetical protein